MDIESMFEAFRSEVNASIDKNETASSEMVSRPGVGFHEGPDADSRHGPLRHRGMTEDAIAAAQVVRHAVATESADASLLTIKVAGEQGGRRCPLDAETESQLKAYIAEIKGRRSVDGAREYRSRPLQL